MAAVFVNSVPPSVMPPSESDMIPPIMSPEEDVTATDAVADEPLLTAAVPNGVPETSAPMIETARTASWSKPEVEAIMFGVPGVGLS